MNPKWVLKAAVLSIHYEQILEHGGVRGIRSLSLLESAIHRPQDKWFYRANKRISLLDLGAAYCYSLTKNHPFFDGNKRTALVTTFLFLRRNSIEIVATRQDSFLLMVGISESKFTEQQIVHWLRERKSRKSP
ncbi:MAG: type II toxin-antitoxin system death-on-curing family toxin [Rickettsia sp.]|nr:type II toxin-antitoxin system death-on-curing family toxin [Rickettsia sp.]